MKNKNILGKNHPSVAINYNNLSLYFLSQNRYDKALFYTKKSIKINKNYFKLNTPQRIRDYNHLSIIYLNQRKYRNALRLQKILVIKYEEILGKNHLDTASMYNNIAQTYNSIALNGDSSNKIYYFNQAIYYMEMSIGIMINKVFSSHVNLKTSLNGLATFKQNKLLSEIEEINYKVQHNIFTTEDEKNKIYNFLGLDR